MNLTEQQIEWIVAEVIRRLREFPREGEAPAEPNRNLTLLESLVTLRTVEGKLAGVTRVLVAPRAVVTPAVKDELKSRKIQLERTSG